jgi:hypothetical protein
MSKKFTKKVAKKSNVKVAAKAAPKSNGVSMKSATRVGKRGWSLDKFTEAVKKRCKRMGVTFTQSKVDACYEEGVTIPDTVNVLRNA